MKLVVFEICRNFSLVPKKLRMEYQNLSPIVLVDDDIDECNLFQEALQELKIDNELLCFHNASSFLEFIVKENFYPAITFIDLHIHNFSGIELIEKIRGNDSFKSTPIALYSNSSNPKDIENAYSSGATLYIQKPNTFEKLKQTIEECLQKSKA